MIPIPEVRDVDMVFGNIKHLPKREDLPEEYQRSWHDSSQPFCHAISQWFFNGAKLDENGNLVVDGVTFNPKPGVDSNKALRAIKAAMSSWEPKHEHKIGACGYFLSEWFDLQQ